MKARFLELAEAHLQEPLGAADGWPEAALAEAEARLGRGLPAALRAYYATMGRSPAVAYNELVPPGELEPADGYLVFMHENQGVVSWGIRIEDLDADDPEVFQRNNTPPAAWYSEEKTFLAFIESMLELLSPRPGGAGS